MPQLTKDPDMVRSINNMVHDSLVITMRHDRKQTKRLQEIWSETSILMNEWWEETKEKVDWVEWKQ